MICFLDFCFLSNGNNNLGIPVLDFMNPCIYKYLYIQAYIPHMSLPLNIGMLNKKQDLNGIIRVYTIVKISNTNGNIQRQRKAFAVS